MSIATSADRVAQFKNFVLQKADALLAFLELQSSESKEDSAIEAFLKETSQKLVHIAGCRQLLHAITETIPPYLGLAEPQTALQEVSFKATMQSDTTAQLTRIERSVKQLLDQMQGRRVNF